MGIINTLHVYELRVQKVSYCVEKILCELCFPWISPMANCAVAVLSTVHIKDPNVTLCPVEQCLSVLYLVTYLGLQVAERLECAVV